MYDSGVLVITIKLNYSKVRLPVSRYYFSKVPSTDTAVRLRSTVPTIVYFRKQNHDKRQKEIFEVERSFFA